MSEWISVKDRLPFPDDFVLLFRNVYPKFFWMGTFKDYKLDDSVDEFTYWMPLPQPPTEASLCDTQESNLQVSDQNPAQSS